MAHTSIYFIGTLLSIVFFVTITTVASAPSNSTELKLTVNATKPGKSETSVKLIPSVTLTSNNTKSNNKTAESEEDCEPEPEPEKEAGAKKNATPADRQGKKLEPIDLEKDKYKAGHDSAAAEPEPINEHADKSKSEKNASQPGGNGDAAKLLSNSSSTTATTVAPSVGASSALLPSLWTNVIFAILFTSFTYSAL